MKKLIFLFLINFWVISLFAQSSSGRIYTVKGIVKDTSGLTVIGAAVKLKIGADSILTSTDVNGAYSFSNVKSASFTLGVKSLGFEPAEKSFSFKPENTQITIPTIILKTQSNMLNQVVVDGTPAIVYKTDTTQFRASDYKVRENATVEDLVKKMEGLEVDKDGALTVQGEAVIRARINGKDYFGGDVANAIKNLPADIVDKIQIVDDYGDEAAKTGIKDGDPEKVINIVTREDKKIGNRGKFESGIGSSDRYNLNLNGNRFNGNRQLGFKLGLNNTVTGLAGDNNGGGSGGTRQSGRFDAYFNDDLSEKVKFNGSYGYDGSNTNSLNNTTIEEYNTIGTIFSTRNGTADNGGFNHSFRAKLEYNPNKNTWMIFRPNFSYRSYDNSSQNVVVQRGAIRQDQNTSNLSNGTTPNLDLRLNTGHKFNEKGTFLSLDLSFSNNDNNQDRDISNNILYYDTTMNNALVKDSILRRQIGLSNLSQNYRSSLTFSQPLTEKARLEFNGQINYRGYDNQQVTNVLNPNGNFQQVDSLSRIFNYSFTETRLAVNYRFRDKKFNYSVGLTAVPGLLRGESKSNNNTTRRTSFNIIPILRFDYEWSKQKKVSLRYYGRPQEPSYDQIQDVPDVTNPQNIVIGNPNLKPAFRHYMRADYNNYIIDSKITLHGRISGSLNSNQVVRKNLLIEDVVDNITTYRRETRYVNSDGNYDYSFDYDFSKRFADKYAISFNGDYDFNHSISFANNPEVLSQTVENIGKTYQTRHRLGLQITPNEWLELVPNVRYSTSKTDFSLPTSKDNKNTNLALSLDGKTYFFKTLFIGYDLSKNFVKGISANVTSNPFIINTSITKEFFEKRNANISLRVYDLLNQNNFISRRVTENSIIDTRSNAVSQYFMLSLSWSPQKWSGGKNNDRGGYRNGDGSYRN